MCVGAWAGRRHWFPVTWVLALDIGRESRLSPIVPGVFSGVILHLLPGENQVGLFGTHTHVSATWDNKFSEGPPFVPATGKCGHLPQKVDVFYPPKKLGF
jgi:hypothetical protein